MTNKNSSPLTDIDIQLYLANALPFKKKLYFFWATIFDKGLRARCKRLRAQNDEYIQNHMPGIKNKLTQATARRYPQTIKKLTSPFWRRLAFHPALATAGALALIALIVMIQLPLQKPPLYDATPKGRSLGANLLVKGPKGTQLLSAKGIIRVSDTLQFQPVGSSNQYMLVFASDSGGALVQIFPTTPGGSQMVSKNSPPTALVTDEPGLQYLICVTSTTVLSPSEIKSLLRQKPFLPLAQAPPIHLDKHMSIQITRLEVLP